MSLSWAFDGYYLQVFIIWRDSPFQAGLRFFCQNLMSLDTLQIKKTHTVGYLLADMMSSRGASDRIQSTLQGKKNYQMTFMTLYHNPGGHLSNRPVPRKRKI